MPYDLRLDYDYWSYRRIFSHRNLWDDADWLTQKCRGRHGLGAP